MSVILGFLVLVALAGAAPTKEAYCESFKLGKKFDHETLSGTIWKTFHVNQKPDETDAFFGARFSWFYTLTPGEIRVYHNEMGQDFPSIDWSNVKYSWNFDNHKNFKYGDTGRFKFIIELNDGPNGDVTAIPAGETYLYLKRTGADMTTLKYRFREIGNSLAVVSCDADHKYLLSRGFKEPDPEDVKLMYEL